MSQVELGKKIKVHSSKRKTNLYLNLLNNISDQLQQDTHNKYKFGDYLTITPDGSVELTYYGESMDFPPMIKFIGETVSQKGKFKQSSIDSAKSMIVNRVLTQSRDNEKINALIKTIFVRDLKEKTLEDLKQLPELHRLYDDIIDKLPADKKLWQYNRNVLNPVRKDIDRFVDSWINKYHESDFQELLQVLKKEEKIYQKAYGGSKNNFAKNQIHDLYARLGNVVLKNIKELLKEDFVPDRIPEDQLEEPFQDIPASIEKQYEKNYEEKGDESNGSPVSFKYSKEYKLARKYLYGTKQIKQDQKKAFSLFTQEAKKGNLLAKYDLAYCYDKGIGCTPSSETAFLLYRDVLSELEDETDKLMGSHNEKEKSKASYLNYRIGKMYYYGQGTEINYEKAFRYFSFGEDHELNSVFSKYYLGKMYENGDFVKQDATKAFEYYSAAHLSPFAAFKTAYMLERGQGTEIDEARAQKWYQSALFSFENMIKEHPNDFLEYRVGRMYLDGKGVEQDIERGISFLELSSKAGNDMATYTLAMTYMKNGNSSPEILKKAMEYLQKSAQQGNQWAQYKLGNIYLDMGNIDQGISYLEKSAKNNIAANYRLGVFFSQNEEYFDFEKAETYLKKSISNNFSAAEYQLGSLYLLSSSLQDIQSGIQYLEQAAQKGNSFAQFKLGKIYYYGNNFIQPDRNKAKEYFNAAAKNGNIYAQNFLKNVKDKKRENERKQHSFRFFSSHELGENFVRLLHSMGKEYKTRQNYLNQQAYRRLQLELENQIAEYDEEK